MKNFVKILLLMVVGFGMGAIAATLKKPRSATPPAVISATETPVTTPEAAATPVTPSTTPETPAAGVQVENKMISSSLTDPDETPLGTSLGEAVAVEEPAAVVVKAPESTPDTPKTDMPVESPAPAVSATFLLTDHNGVAVTEKSWPDKFLLVFFGFTHCPDICPMALEKFTVSLEKLGADADKVQVLFITVDPARDDAAAMKEYVAKFNKSIVGLTGTEAQVKAAIAAFKVYAAKASGSDDKNYLMDHSAFTYFIGPDGQVKEVIKMSDSAAEMVAKIKPALDAAK